MTVNGIEQIVLYLVILGILIKPLGIYMAKVYEGETLGIMNIFNPVEKFIFKICGIKKEEEMSWQMYATAVLLFSLAGIVILYLIQRLQNIIPLNPQQWPELCKYLLFLSLFHNLSQDRRGSKLWVYRKRFLHF